MPTQKTNIILAMGYFSLCMTMIIIARLFYLQISHHDLYVQQSAHNYIRYESICTTRGEILDSKGKKIATNRPLISIYWQGTGNRILHASQHELLALVQKHISAFNCNENILQRVRKAERTNERVLLCDTIDTIELSCIEELCGAHKNILIHYDIQRHYPHNQAACHIIGYISGPQKRQLGSMGLEKYLEDTLQGTNGTRIKTVNSYGKKINSLETEASVNGNSIHTTLDIGLQLLAEKVFTQPHEGTFILMDPKNGAIKALVSLPNFDPTLFLAPIDPETWHTIQNKKPFQNKALQCTYPPGSLFKLITISAALEHGIIKAHDTFVCKGHTEFCGRKYLCNRTTGHGKLSIQQALATSCNPLFYELGKQIKIDTLADYAHRFGLGEKTGITLPEQHGLIPTSDWKKQTHGERWWPGETLSATIGQSYLLVTPMQIARMTSSIFTGYLVKPRILLNEPIEKAQLNIQPETINFLKDSMRSVVTEGTGRRVNRIKDFLIHAKTSTAQMSNMAKRKLGKQFLEHGWVVAHFAYKDHDPLVMVILVEHAGSSRVPMLIAKEFLLSYRDLSSDL